jgi:hypothetical protein
MRIVTLQSASSLTWPRLAAPPLPRDFEAQASRFLGHPREFVLFSHYQS